ncbi:hypothetical protein EVAR_87750_1 [Eumeta japonica]|uniref:MADF domain-containing protein n=1 Tax=Eumeta variegata TaxID=151549 RepID=A0A4C1ZMI5_EUMVA|nr:hypothetical protein EVAR_87750_1 [Eumeta japonica]
MTTEEDDIASIDLLIDEIEKRDAIWNINSKEYSNKIIKRRSWEELVLIFCSNNDSEEKKKNLERYQSAEVQPFEEINYPSTSYSLQQQPRSSFRSPQYRDSMRYSARESSTQYGYTTSSYASPPTNLSQATSPGSYEDSQELDLFDHNN